MEGAAEVGEEAVGGVGRSGGDGAYAGVVEDDGVGVCCVVRDVVRCVSFFSGLGVRSLMTLIVAIAM